MALPGRTLGVTETTLIRHLRRLSESRMYDSLLPSRQDGNMLHFYVVPAFLYDKRSYKKYEAHFVWPVVSNPRQHSAPYYTGGVNYLNNYNMMFYQNIHSVVYFWHNLCSTESKPKVGK